MKLTELACAFCGRYHNERELRDGWVALGLTHNKKSGYGAKRLICPECLKWARVVSGDGSGSSGRF